MFGGKARELFLVCPTGKLTRLLQREIAAGEGSGELYNGIDTANQGYFGLGRTWNVGLRYKF